MVHTDKGTGVRTRFAPSPTGDLHVGTAHTGLFNWLFTRHHGGTVVLRIEDTDRKRLVPRSLGGIPEALGWLGIDWDEGPGVGGPYGPYFQSERQELHQRYAEQLVAQGDAYYCFCTPERLAEVRQERQAKNILPTGYDRHCRNIPPDEARRRVAAGEPHVVRLKMPLEGQITVTDLIRGEITFDARTLEDAVLIKSDGYSLYHFANVIDDHEMAITHILRGEDWIPSAPLHVVLYRAFGWAMPKLAHTMLLLGPDRKKLSKRHGATSIQEFRDQGILSEALVNYLAIIGWSWDDKQEIFSREELIEKFDLDRVKASSAIFDHQKLEWMNGYYINHLLTLDELTARALPFLARAGLVDIATVTPGTPAYEHIKDVLALEKDRIKLLSDIPEMTAYFFTPTVEYTPEVLLNKKQKLTPEQVREVLPAARDAIAAGDVADEAGTEARLDEVVARFGLKRGQVFMLVRAAVSGRTATPGLFETLRVLGQPTCLARLDAAVAWVEGRG
ncbi:MAG TPA: glutamate--tRNA ligase [Thermomicrobiales bacterium]|nr:glutamate--tRNA ligase [Thermomicrobiales bacterium]